MLISKVNYCLILRCLIDKIILHRTQPDCAQVRIVWKGGATSVLSVPLKVSALQNLSNADAFKAALQVQLTSTTPLSDKQIAQMLTAQGFRSPLSHQVLVHTVQRLRLQQGLYRQGGSSAKRHVAGYLTIPQLAARLPCKASWLYNRLEKGRILLNVRKHPGLYLFPDTPTTWQQLKQLQNKWVKTVLINEGATVGLE